MRNKKGFMRELEIPVECPVCGESIKEQVSSLCFTEVHGKRVNYRWVHRADYECHNQVVILSKAKPDWNGTCRNATKVAIELRARKVK